MRPLCSNSALLESRELLRGVPEVISSTIAYWRTASLLCPVTFVATDRETAARSRLRPAVRRTSCSRLPRQPAASQATRQERTDRGVTWLEPRLVAEVSFTHAIPGGGLRAPVFRRCAARQ